MALDELSDDEFYTAFNYFLYHFAQVKIAVEEKIIACKLLI